MHPNGIEPTPRRGKNLRVKSYDAVADPKAFAKLGRALVKKRVLCRSPQPTRWAKLHRLIAGLTAIMSLAASRYGSADKSRYASRIRARWGSPYGVFGVL